MTHERFSGANWYNKFEDISVIGLGGIGSYLAPFLAKLGHNLFIYDFDTVDIVNHPQNFTIKDLGKSKQDVIAQKIKLESDVDVSKEGKFTKNSPLADIVFVCVDSITVRKEIFESWKKIETRKLLIDGRLLMEEGMVFIVRKGDEEKYEKTLFDESESIKRNCTTALTPHGGAFISSIMIAKFNNWLSQEEIDTSFAFTFNLRLMSFQDHDKFEV